MRAVIVETGMYMKRRQSNIFACGYCQLYAMLMHDICKERSRGEKIH